MVFFIFLWNELPVAVFFNVPGRMGEPVVSEELQAVRHVYPASACVP